MKKGFILGIILLLVILIIIAVVNLIGSDESTTNSEPISSIETVDFTDEIVLEDDDDDYYSDSEINKGILIDDQEISGEFSQIDSLLRTVELDEVK